MTRGPMDRTGVGIEVAPEETLLSGAYEALTDPGARAGSPEDLFERKILAIRGTRVGLDDMLRGIATLKASDLFLKTGSPVRFKVAGRVVTFESDRITREMMEHVLDCFLGEQDKRLFHERQAADLVHVTDAARYRVHFAMAQSGVYATIRIIANDVRPLASLGLPDGVVQSLKQFRTGLLLVCGVTDSGKTVTCTSLIDSLNQERELGILSLEDPIEYIFREGRSMVIQREVNLHVASFSDGVKAALRENLDVIYVGEIRDRETIEQVLKATETGHLVITTLHSDDCISALNRIIGTFPMEDQPRIRMALAGTLTGVLFQRLLPTPSGGRVPCVESLWASTAVRSIVRAGDLSKLTSYVGRATGGIGYRECLTDLLRRRAIARDVHDAELSRLNS